MKKRIWAAFFILAALFTFISVHVYAEESSLFIIDEMTARSEWHSSSLTVSRSAYTDETSHLATSESDKGYLVFGASGAESGKELTARREFSELVNLYKYSTVSFDYNISADADAAVSYTLTVTLFSGDSSVSSSFAAETGKWAKAYFPIGTWNKRSAVDAISVTVSPVFESGDGTAKTAVAFCLDGIRAEGSTDTSYEDRFMTSSFSVKDGSVTNYTDGTVLWRHASASSISANISYSDAAEALGHNALRAVISVGTDTELRLTAAYTDGTVYESKAQTVAAGSDPVACYFSFPSPEKALRFALVSDTKLGGTVTLYGIDTVYLPSASAETALGTLDVCAIGADGSLNLRGTVTSDAVIEHIDGTIRIYAVPVYSSAEAAVLSSDPVAETTMTTRFNITVEPSDLPDGAAAMRYAVVIADKTSLISVCKPSLPETEKAGASLPSRSDSLKGITDAEITHEAGLTEISVDLGSLFGSPSSSKIYSSFGELYYFDTESLARLDSAVKAVSLSGTNVYLRITRTNEDSSPVLLSADDQKSFRELYTAVDFLTSRYSSDDYGYVNGIIVGSSVTDASALTEDSQKIRSLINAAAVVAGAGGKNIAGFRTILPMGDTFTDISPSLSSSELSLRLIAYYAGELGLGDYGIIWQTDTVLSSPDSHGVEGADAVSKYAASLYGAAPEYYFVKYTPADTAYSDSASLLKYAVRAYFAACTQSSVHGFIFDAKNADDALFDRVFAKIDTNGFSDAISSVLLPGEDMPLPSKTAEKRAFSRTVSSVTAKTAINTLGSAAIFDYTDSFYTGGWFNLSDSGECITVKTDSGRVMRFTDGIMYSCPSAPIDLSSSPVLSFELYADSIRSYSLTLISKSSSLSSEFTVTASSGRVFFDLSEFDGISAVTGILLRPTEPDTGYVYIKNVSAGSFLLTDEELTALFDSASSNSSDAQSEPEENIVEIIAVVSVAAVISALTLSILRRKKN